MKITSYIKSMRPETWFLGGVPLIFMSVLASNFSFSLSMFIETFLLFFISIILILGGTNMFNEVFDIEADRFNKPHRPIVSKKISRKSAFFLSSAFFILALIMSFYLNINLFYLTTIAVFFGIAYSLPKIRFKDNPVSSMLTLGVGYGVLIPLSPWIMFSENRISIGLLIALLSFIWFMGTTNFKDFKDIVGDKVNRTKTLTLRIGVKKTIKIMILLMSIIPSIILGIYIYENIFPLLCSLVFVSFATAFILLYKIMKNYSPDFAFRGYKLTYIIYPSIFILFTIGFWLGG
jgi:geranylgeranylglycerol-phosphate geranylgeranyltransferase